MQGGSEILLSVESNYRADLSSSQSEGTTPVLALFPTQADSEKQVPPNTKLVIARLKKMKQIWKFISKEFALHF